MTIDLGFRANLVGTGKTDTIDLIRFCGIPWRDEKVDVFELSQLAVGVLSLGSLLVGGGFYVVRQHQRATSRFFKSLLVISKSKLSKIDYSVLPRGHMSVGIDNEPVKKLNLHRSFNSVTLVGDNRSGKTVYLANVILNEMYPWWYRYLCPPRGLFLTGDQQSPTIDSWLKDQIGTTEKDCPWSAIMDLLSERREEQRVRAFLHGVFKSKLPTFLMPQPAIIVVDQAEELLRAYRADFLVSFHSLAKKNKNTDLVLLVLVINTENAVKALELMYGGNMFTIIQAPKVSREAVVINYGEDFAKIFDDCNSCIGVALDYVDDEIQSKGVSARKYAEDEKERYRLDNCLVREITREEHAKAGQHS